MIKRSPVSLFNRYCKFHMCHNRHCQLPKVASVFRLASCIAFFFAENICLVMPPHYHNSIHFDELSVFTKNNFHGLLRFCSVNE